MPTGVAVCAEPGQLGFECGVIHAEMVHRRDKP